jgi:hypothetical protein
MIGLLVFFALAVPIAIHIISRSQGKVVPFPFLALLPTQAASTELRIVLRQKWLLFVRLLLVLCACLLVSLSLLNDWWLASEWRELFVSEPASPTVVVTQDWWISSSEPSKKALKAQLNSDEFARVDDIILVTHNGGATLHYVAKNSLFNATSSTAIFLRLPQASISGGSQTIANTPNPPLTNQWAMAQAIAQSIPADSALHIYTSNRYSQFFGDATYVRQPVTWHISDIADNAKNTAIPTITLALIGVDAANTNLEQIQRMANTEMALVSLKSSYSTIESSYIKNEDADSLALLADKYDVLLIDLLENSEGIKRDNIVNLAKLPTSSQADFIIALGEETFRNTQQEYLFSKTGLTPQQIKNDGKGVSRPPVSAIPPGQTHHWQKYLAILLVILFVLERIMSEQRAIMLRDSSIDKQEQ